MDLIEQIGAALGLAAFAGLAILVLLYFQQAREVRRLREWAGKAPERAAAAEAERALARAEAAAEGARGERGPGRVRRALAALGRRLRHGWQAVDRRSPLDLRAAVVLLAVVGIGVGAAVTSGYGLLGGDAGAPRQAARGGEPRAERPPPPAPPEIAVAVLNGTTTGTSPGVPGLAGEVSERMAALGYELGPVTDTQTPFTQTVVMYAPGYRREASEVVANLPPELSPAPLAEMSEEVRVLAAGTGVALVVGQNNAAL